MSFSASVQQQAQRATLGRARELLQQSVVIDLHADTPALMRRGYDLTRRHRPPLPGGFLLGHLDLPRLAEVHASGQIFGLASRPRRLWPGDLGPAAAVAAQIQTLEQAAARAPQLLTLPRTFGELRAALARGIFAGLLGVEGAHALQGQLDRLSDLARQGVVYLGLLHFSRNEAGFPAYGLGRDDRQGLTDFGRALIEALNHQRILVDLAHLNRRGFLEAARLSRAPVIVSHTGLEAAHPHWRNIEDDQVRAVAQTGGCVGIIFDRGFLGGPELEQVCRHLEQLIRLGGEDCAALGSDFDGLIRPVRQLQDITGLPCLVAALLARGLPERQVQKLLGANLLRVLEAGWS